MNELLFAIIPGTPQAQGSKRSLRHGSLFSGYGGGV